MNGDEDDSDGRLSNPKVRSSACDLRVDWRDGWLLVERERRSADDNEGDGKDDERNGCFVSKLSMGADEDRR